MSVISKYLARASLAGAMALASSNALAQEEQSAADVRLSQSEWSALQVVKDFNTCVENAQRSWAMPNRYSLVENFEEQQAEWRAYQESVVEPYEAALQEYRKASGYMPKIAEARYRLERAYPQARAEVDAGRTYSPLVQAYKLLQDEYDLLMDQSEAEFATITTLEIPEEPEFGASDADAYSETVISGCAKQLENGIREWVNVVWGEMSGGYMAPDLQNVRFNLALKELKQEIGAKTYIDLTRAP